MTRTPKATPLPIEYTEDGDEILNLLTCYTCGFVSFNEVYDICPKCLKTVNYIPAKSDKE